MKSRFYSNSIEEKAMTLIRRPLMGILLLAGAMALNMAHAQDAKAPVLARFANGETITETDLDAYLQRRVDLKAVARNASGLATVLQEMALTRTLALEGSEMGVPRLTGKEDERFDDGYALAIFKQLSPACEPPKDETAARDFYDKNPKAFTVPTAVRLARIILPAGQKLDGEPAGLWLMNQVQAIGTGQQKFDDAVAKANQVYKLDAQGDLGWVLLNDESALLGALASAQQGDLVGPVIDGDYVYLFQINAKRDSRLLPWADVSATAPKRAVSYCREQGQAQLKERLFKKYAVRFDDAAISGIFNKK